MSLPERIEDGRAQWRLVGSLTAIGALALIDKNIVLLLVTPIKVDIGLSDTQIGLIIGLAFALVNICASLPAGWLADRYNRKGVVAAGVLLWSAFTVGCAFSRNFVTLFLCRAGVGMSEALIPPAAISLIRDGVTPDRRERALSIYAMATTSGTGLALALGGLLYAWITTLDLSAVPLFRGMQPWAITLFVAGVAGMPFCLLLLSFAEPGRGRVDSAAAGPTLREAIDEMWHLRALYVPLLLFSVAQALSAMSIASWQPSFMVRKFGIGPADVGVPTGIMLMTISPVGLYLVGLLLARLRERGKLGYGTAGSAMTLVTVPAAVALPYAPTIGWTWLCLGIFLLGSMAYLLIVSAAVSRVATPRNVGRTMSVFLLAQAAVGSGVAPVLVPLTATYFSGALAPALSLLCAAYGIMALLGGVWLFRAERRWLRDTPGTIARGHRGEANLQLSV